ncbi:MAG: hypothetical protein BWY05_01112 [Euryarchaeota archaeon ADurb.Bin165]|jgi:hypothetical protein|nr:MAG: hypothetical protein BWY05_01112 [Euryarchaeota archaeon ADurb.Bin165]
MDKGFIVNKKISDGLNLPAPVISPDDEDM